ncbi:capsid protein [Kosakonia sacchari]|uniref:capsid protein n=1 Tax=Kosakonia sacchari TaxID=1158459 RepID=UPI0015849F58|nr:capsid protein [Kosakonia sacchari]NUL39425.1 capsid protein [Kosakonia sacchari]
MKTELITAVMKTLGSTQDAKTRTAIDSALDAMNKKASEESAVAVNRAVETFTQAKAAHTGNMMKLNDIGAAITRSEKERENALTESAEAEQSWRERFRTLRGEMTPELKAEHGRRIAGRELAEEFTALIAELETDKSRAMLAACASGEKYVEEHRTAFGLYAQSEWADAMKTISPALVRAFALRLRALEMQQAERPLNTLIQELGGHVSVQAGFYTFDMDREPVLSQLGMHRPPLTGVDMALYKSPVKRTLLATRLAEKRKQAEG